MEAISDSGAAGSLAESTKGQVVKSRSVAQGLPPCRGAN